jgi:beta-glucosidase
VASLLFGDAVPSGKLTITFPKATADLPPFEDYSMAGRTYRYAEREPLYPFGFGLSYTTFSYRHLKVTSPRASGFNVSVTVQNTGAVAADEVVQFYLNALETRLPVPISQLIGFRRVSLKPGQSKTVKLVVVPEMLMQFNEDGQQIFEPGKFRLTAGSCSPGSRGMTLGAPQPMSVEFSIL